MKLTKLKLSYIAFLVLIAIGFTSCQEDELLEQTQELQQTTPDHSNKKNKDQRDITTASSVTPRVLINGNPLVWPNALAIPENRGGYVMVYMRTIFESLGYSIQWIQSDPWREGRSSVIARKADGTVIQIWVGDRMAQVNGAWIQFPTNAMPYNNNGYVMVHSRFVADHSGASTEWDQQTQSVQMYDYNKLDYGFYFFDSQPSSNPTGDAVGCQKYDPNVSISTRFFDPNKPTIIYVHGNAPGSIVKGAAGREGFYLNDGGINRQTHNAWKAQGWNVAIFYWIQFADEGVLGSLPTPTNVEKKIYDANTNVKMRWKKSDNSLTEVNMPNVPVRNLFATKYLEIFESSYNQEIRVVGNSLGGNLTMASLLRLHRLGAPRMPSRVTLVDPFWGPVSKTDAFLGENATNTADLGGISAEVLAARGIAIEYLRSSLLGASGSSERVAKTAAFAHFGVDFNYNPLNKHTIPVRQYLDSRYVTASLEVSRPNLWSPWQNTGKDAMSANTSNARIREMMGGVRHWNHVVGRNTPSMHDDRYELIYGFIW